MYIALKEIRRSLGRFGLLTFAVALLVILLLFFQAVAGTLTSGITGGLEASAADVLAYDERARRNPATSVIPIENVERIAGLPGVAAVSPIGLGVFTGDRAGEDLDLQLVGGDPTGPSVPATIADGRLPGKPGEALYSGSSFDDAIEIGELVTIEGTPFEIVGSADDAAFNVLPTLYVNYEDFVTVTQTRAGVPFDVPPSLIGIEVADGTNPAAVAAAVTTQLDGIEALERDDAVQALPGVSQITQSFNILYLLLYIVVTIVTGVFFLILTVQKKDSLVLLRAIGTSAGDVIGSVLIQVLIVVGVGALIGTAVTAGLLRMSRDVFGAALRPGTTALTVTAIIVLGLLASVGALRRVFAIDPIEATRTGGIR